MGLKEGLQGGKGWSMVGNECPRLIVNLIITPAMDSARIGTELEQNWNRIGTELERNWNGIGTELASPKCKNHKTEKMGGTQCGTSQNRGHGFERMSWVHSGPLSKNGSKRRAPRWERMVHGGK